MRFLHPRPRELAMRTVLLSYLLLLPAAPPEEALPKTTKVRYKGRDASQWGPDLLDADYPTARRAAMALEAIGAEGLRYFLQGLKSDNDKTNYLSLDCLPPVAGKYEKV